MKYESSADSIELTFSASNKGKFRFKTRKTNVDFGTSFGTRSNEFNETVYLEWQIGYDIPTTVINEDGSHPTKLTEFSFVGSNGKTKYLYELSEILCEAVIIKLVTANEIDSLLREIQGYDDFIDKNEIVVGEHTIIELNELPFIETSIKLPTLFMPQNSDGTQIEISIQKQQYAYGFQPMIYFCIPFRTFINWNELNGRCSVAGNGLKYTIDKNNIIVIMNLFRIFGMSSARHKNDIMKILSIIIDYSIINNP